MARYYETTFHESGTGQTRTLLGQGNTRVSAARAARRKLRAAVGDTSRWHEIKTTFVPGGGRRAR
jgi:hypothetical protein